MTRRSSHPSIPIPEDALRGTRRAAGPRFESTERVRLHHEGGELAGWTLNVSRGGARLVVEGTLELGGTYGLQVGDAPESRDVAVIWVQDEPDGQIVGVRFLDVDGTVPPPPRPSSLPPRPQG